MPNSDNALYAIINASAGARTEIVAAVAGKRIRVLSYVATCETATGTFLWESATTAISGVMTMADNGCVVVPAGTTPVLQTAAGEALNITTVASVVRGHLSYITENP